MRRRTVLTIGLLTLLLIVLALHSLDLPGLFGTLNPHTLP